MKLSVKGLAIAAGLLWGGAMLVVGLGATYMGAKQGSYYGQDFLLAMASIYPGYRGTPEMSQALLGAGYGLVDGAIAGGLLAWLYNLASPSTD